MRVGGSGGRAAPTPEGISRAASVFAANTREHFAG